MTVKVSKPAINVREELADLRKPTGLAGEAMLRAETPQEQFNLISAGRRNLLINGDFQVSQRGNYTTASSANVTYFVDRWYTDVASAVSVNRQHITGIDIPDTPSISKGVRLVATSSGTSYAGIRQKIENPTQYVGRTFTYSGWVRSNTPNARLTSYGSGGGNQVSVSEAHSGNGEWEKLSVTFTLTSNVTTAWYVSAFISSSGIGSVAQVTGDYIEITQLQLELGKVATPFEHRSYGEELALCQRYYEKTYNQSVVPATATAIGGVSTGGVAGNNTTSEIGSRFNFEVSKRAVPTVTIYDLAGNVGKVTRGLYGIGTTANQTGATANIAETGVFITSASGSDASEFYAHYTADAEL